MVSETALVERLREFLRSSDLNKTTTAIVRCRLEEDFGVDLSDRKAFIREQIDLFLQSQLENDKDFEGGDSGSEAKEDEGEDGNEVGEASEEEVEVEKRAATNGRDGKKRGLNKLNNDNKRKGGGFSKLCSLSPQLQKFVGVSELARTEVVKQIWAYIREKKLQDPDNKRNILCDEALQVLFGVKSINMFQMNKVLSKHIWPLTSDDGPEKPGKPTQKEKQRRQESDGPDESAPKEKRRKGVSSRAESKKGGGSGFLAPLPLSDALMKFIGTGESALSRADVVKRMWDYIKLNKLQDPTDKRKVICDEKLKELFEVDSFNGFTVSKLLTSHFIKAEQ